MDLRPYHFGLVMQSEGANQSIFRNADKALKAQGKFIPFVGSQKEREELQQKNGKKKVARFEDGRHGKHRLIVFTSYSTPYQITPSHAFLTYTLSLTHICHTHDHSSPHYLFFTVLLPRQVQGSTDRIKLKKVLSSPDTKWNYGTMI